MHPRVQLRKAIVRHEAERWWYRRGVWWFAFLVPRSIRYWIIVQAANRYAHDHPTQEVPAITAFQVMEGVYPERDQ